MNREKLRNRKKIAKQKNLRNQKIEKLKQQAKELKQKIKKQTIDNIKNICIKNLKYVGSILNFLAPFVLSACITFGVFKLFGGGNPVVKDDITKYKKYSLSYQTNGNIEAYENYEENYWYSTELPENMLMLYYPWTLNDNGTYSRIIREYNVDNLQTTDLYKAILAQDVDYIINTFGNYKESQETSNHLYDNNDGYVVEANINIFDKGDFIKYSESDLKNILITISEIVIALGSAGIITKKRNFKLGSSIRRINNRYIITPISPLKQELKATKKKILTLEKGGKI